MVDIFLDEPVNGSGKVRIGDPGLTLMRLIYTFDLDTENQRRIFDRILSENRIQEQDGRLFLDAEPERLYPALLHFAQTIAKVSSMEYYQREVIQNLFYEQRAEFVEENLAEYHPRRRRSHHLCSRLPAGIAREPPRVHRLPGPAPRQTGAS